MGARPLELDARKQQEGSGRRRPACVSRHMSQRVVMCLVARLYGLQAGGPRRFTADYQCLLDSYRET